MTAVGYPRPAQLAQLGPRHNVVESSAGTGKTYLLEHLFVDLILSHGIPAEELLVVTFTEKATAELVLRLRRLIGELAELRPEHPKAVPATAPDAWCIDERARATLAQAVLGFDRLSIFTMHGFCQRVLAEHAFVQGRLFDEQVVGAEAVFAEAFAQAVRTRFTVEPELAAVLATWLAAGKTLAALHELLAKCDAHKTAVLRPRLDRERLAAELAAWQPVAADDAALTRWLAGVTSMQAGTRVKCRDSVGRISDAVAASAGDPLRFVALPGVRDDVCYLLARLAGRMLGDDLDGLVERVTRLRDAMVPLEALAVQAFLPVVRELAQAGKRAAGHFDFDDMIGLVDQVLREGGPRGAALAASLRGRYRHALIDEFQDTDELQWSIFRRLFVEPADHHGLTVIGDPKQAIYAFRGANVATYQEACHDLLGQGATHLDLDDCFRASADMVGALNRLFDQQAGFFRPESGIRYDRPVRCGRPGRRLVSTTDEAPAPVAILDVETTTKLAADATRALVATAIAREIADLLSPDSPLRLRDSEQEQRLSPRNVFVLTFAATDSALVGRALARARVPYAFYKQSDLFATAEAAEVLDVLRAICAPEHRGLRARALLSRFFGYSLTEVAAACAPDSRATQLLLRLAGLARTGDVPALFAALSDETAVLRRELVAGAGERGLTNFMHVLELLSAEWMRRHLGVPELADLLASYVQKTAAPPGQEGDLQRLETDADAVQILTVHKAKGLEADVVFVFGGLGQSNTDRVRVVHEGSRRVAWVGPLDQPVEQRYREEQHDEDCRLLYVAATRARYRLYLPHYPSQVRVTGRYRPMNDRLDALLGGGDVPGFDRHALAAGAGTPEIPDAPRAPAPPPAAVPGAVPAPPADVEEIRRQRRGFLVTSYSAVRRARSGHAPAVEITPWPNPDEPVRGDPVPDQGLPGGAETGIFLHELLARVSLAELATAPELSAWLDQPQTAALLERQRRRFARPAEQVPAAARLVHAAYSRPVRLGELSLPNLASASASLREMEFLYPMPETSHALLHHCPPGEPTWRVERGVVKGFIDLLFEHDGRLYVCDWKSDLLPGYAPADLTGHCHAHYDVQARLYTLAALRLGGIGDEATFAARFGGVLFCFLRGRLGGGEQDGLVWLAPTWRQVLDWEREMLAPSFWGLDR